MLDSNSGHAAAGGDNVNPDPALVVKALDDAFEWCSDTRYVWSRLLEAKEHAEAIAEMWPTLQADSDALPRLVAENWRSVQELIAAAKAWDFAKRNPYQLNMPKCEERLRAALKPFEEQP